MSYSVASHDERGGRGGEGDGGWFYGGDINIRVSGAYHNPILPRVKVSTSLSVLGSLLKLATMVIE